MFSEQPVDTASGFTSFNYCLSPRGKSFMMSLVSNGGQCLGGASSEFLKRMNAKSARELELLSALHYLICTGMGVDEATQAVKEHKSHQHYTDQECADAVAELRKEGLIA